MNELITVALETGRGGVRSFKFKEVEAEAEPAPVVSVLLPLH